MISDTHKNSDTVPLVPVVLKPSNALWEQFVRYVLVGGLAFLGDFGCYALVLQTWGQEHYQIAGATGFLLGSIINYVLSIFWVFNKRSSQNAGIEFVLFVIIGAVGLGLNGLILWLLISGMSQNPLIAKIIAAGLVLVWNFSARKFLLFS